MLFKSLLFCQSEFWRWICFFCHWIGWPPASYPAVGGFIEWLRPSLQFTNGLFETRECRDGWPLHELRYTLIHWKSPPKDRGRIVLQVKVNENAPLFTSLRSSIRVNLVAFLFLVGRAHWFAWIRQKTNKKKMAVRSALSRFLALLRRQNSSHAACAAVANVAQHRLRQCSLDLLHCSTLAAKLRCDCRWTQAYSCNNYSTKAKKRASLLLLSSMGGRASIGTSWTSAMSKSFKFSQSLKSWCETSAEEKRPPQFRFAIPRKSGEEEDQAEWSLRCFVGKGRGGATVEVGGSFAARQHNSLGDLSLWRWRPGNILFVVRHFFPLSIDILYLNELWEKQLIVRLMRALTCSLRLQLGLSQLLLLLWQHWGLGGWGRAERTVPASPPSVRCLQRTRTSCTDTWACPRCCPAAKRMKK